MIERLTAKIRPQILAKDIMSLVVIAIVSLGKDLIQLDKDKAE
jgi:hypothetical protein